VSVLPGGARAVVPRLAVAVLLALSITSARPAHAQQASARLTLASQTPWVRGSAPFGLRLDVDAVRSPEDLDLDVTVHRAVTSRSQFARTLDGESLGGTVHTDRVPFQSLPFDAGGAISLTVDLPDLRTGVYPVSVDLVDTEDGDVVASLVTHLLKVPTTPVEVPLAVAWVQSYGAPPAQRPDGSIALDDDDLDDLRVIARQLDAGVPMTVTPTPETIAALATLDDGRTVAALGELLRDHEVLSRPFVDVDVSALAAAGRSDEIAAQRLEGDRVLDDVAGIVGENRTAVPDGAVTASGLRALAELGVRRVVLDEQALDPLRSADTNGLTLARPFAISTSGGRTLDAVSVDPGLAAHFAEDDPVLAAHHLLADLAVLQLDSPGLRRGVVLRPPVEQGASDVLLSTALAGISSSPLLEGVTVDELMARVEPLEDDDGEPIVRTLAPVDLDPLGFSPAAIDRARDSIRGFSSLLVDPATADMGLLERNLLVAESRDLTTSQRRHSVDSVATRIADATSKVRVLGDRTYRLTAREGTIPLTLVNDNSFAVHVEVELTSDKLEFKGAAPGEPSTLELELGAGSTTTQAVPVKARTSGTFQLGIVVRAPDGALALGATRVTIASTVASGVGIVLSAGALVFLALWWGKHWRTVRRARRLVPAE
jgi:hypothetical protein